MAIASFAERDRQIAALIRAEIEEVKEEQRRFGWKPHSRAWDRAFGKLSGLHAILALIDPAPVPSERDIGQQLGV